MQQNDLGKLVPDRIERRKGRHRFLKDHGDLVAANPAYIPFRLFQQIFVLVAYLSLGHASGRIGDQPHDRKGGDALSAAAFAHDSELFPLAERIVEVTDRLDGSLSSSEFHTEIPYIQQYVILL